jgi:hypothetical protein
MSLEDVSTWRLRTPNGIPYRLLAGTPTGSFNLNTSKFQEKCIVRNSDLFAFIAETLPQTVEWSNGIWDFTSGRSCPGTTGMLASNINTKPFDDSKPCNLGSNDSAAPGGTYSEFVEVTIDYEPYKRNPATPDNPELVDFLEVDAEFSAEFLVIDMSGKDVTRIATTTKPDADGSAVSVGQRVPVRKINANTTKVLPTVDWTVTFPKIRNVTPLRNFVLLARDRMGMVNSSTMPLFLNAEAGTILFLGLSIHGTFSVDEDGNIIPEYSLTMRFNEKRVYEDGIAKGHNYVYQPDSHKFEILLLDGNQMYESTDLNAIWS